MRTFTQTQRPTQKGKPTYAETPMQRFSGRRHVFGSTLHLQRTIGNHAVQRLLETHGDKSSGTFAISASSLSAHNLGQIQQRAKNQIKIQPKLSVGTPGSIFEQEAARVTGQVTNTAPPLNVRYQAGENVQWESHRESLRRTIPPVMQLQKVSEDEERLQARCEPHVRNDFLQVRLNADSEAVRMSQPQGAQAIVHKRDGYLGAGKSLSNEQLTAQELVLRQTGVLQRTSQAVVATIQRMLDCPSSLSEIDPTRWKSYQGDPSVFHCGFTGFLEDRAPTDDDLQNECFYDQSGALVTERHQFAGCRGTPNRYDSRQLGGIPHAILDPGGIARAGAPAFATSRFYDLSRAISSAIQVVSTAGRVIESISAGFGEAIALGVLTARASVDPQNWSFQGLPARSIRHLNMMGMIIGSAALSGNVDNLLRNLTRRLDSFGIAGLLDEIAQDVNQALQSAGVGAQRISASDLGEMSLLQLVDWLRAQGILQYSRSPEDIAREQFRAERAETL